MTEVISVKFKNRGKVYFFDPHGIAVRTGDKVVVETSRGLELAECVLGNHVVPDETVVQPLRSLARIATKDDLRIEEINRRREKEAFQICKQKIAEHGLDMKLVDVECSFEGNKTMFFFTSDGRVDFRELVKDLASVFRNRIELRQIGVRDEAKMLGGIGICGRPYCCSQFLDDFQPVSTKMAKVQSMSLNPSKISGACGRLMCCLRYEQAAYEDLVKAVPKVGAFVETPAGYGTVSSVNILRSSLKVKLDGQGEDVFKSYQADEIAVIPGGRPKPGEPLPSLLKDRPKPVRDEEPK
ncbi:MAG: stage 0 sporulation family protein, partial [Oscillospiraceae bacterium]